MNAISVIWNSLRNFFGDAVLIFALVGMVLVLIEAAVCRKKKPQEDTPENENPEETKGGLPAGARRTRIALITGASSGMGAEFARQIDQKEKNIDQIWLIARRRERMEAVASSLRHKTKVFPLDLTVQENYDRLGTALEMANADVVLFVGCAGYGKIGNYASLTREESNRLIDLNCKASVDMTLTVLPYMQAGDRIIEICSTAAFQPLQHFNLYAASKSFLYYYCRALRMELLPRKISVLAVCPYWVRDTEFIAIAREGEKKRNAAGAIRSFPLAATSKRVVARALRSSQAGFAVSTPGLVCTLHRIFSKVLSKESLLYIWEGLRRI